MKCTIPEISWHNREPVLSIDLHPAETNFYRLASGGSDTLILIWQLRISDNGSVTVEILSEMTRHQKAVNVVKWSPNGNYLASGDDDANIILWQLKTDNVPLLEGEYNFKETWVVYKVLRGHKEDIYDLSWSPDGTKLLSGSVDNTAMMWDVIKAQSETIIRDHKSFVQGVAFDPKNEYFATLSSDRLCRVFETKKCHIKARIAKGFLPVEENHNLHQKEVKYFHDDTFKTFFRRLSFSPDGSILVVPSGSIETEESKNVLFATYIFTLDQLNQPAAMLPIAKQCSIVAKCCPIVFELRPEGPKPYIDLPYRIIIAVATDSDVIIYDTQQLTPFAHLQNIHYTRLTDLSWSSDGLLLVASSTDGFITLVTFEVDELGIKYTKEESETEDSILNISGIEEIPEETVEEVKPKKPSFLEKWAKQANNKRKNEDEMKIDVKKVKSDDEKVVEIKQIAVENVEPKVESAPVVRKRITPKFIAPINKERKVTIDLDNKSVKTSRLATIPAKIIEGPQVKPENSSKIDEKPEISLKIQPDNTSKLQVEPEKSLKNQVKAENSSKIHKKPGNSSKTQLDNSSKLQVEPDKSSKIPLKPENSSKIHENPGNSSKIQVDNTSKPQVESDKSSKIQVKPENSSKTEVKPENLLTKVTKTPTQLQDSKLKTPKTKSADKKGTPRGKPKGIQASTPKISLLQFFKPIPKAEKEAKSTNCDKIDDIIVSDDDDKEGVKKLKINTSKLFNTSNKINLAKTVDLTEDDSCEVPDDFVLKIDDDDSIINDDIKVKTNGEIDDKMVVDDKSSDDDKTNDVKVVTEKENKLEIVDKNVDALKAEAKQPRRIPLITLSSPKNKKKRTDS